MERIFIYQILNALNLLLIQPLLLLTGKYTNFYRSKYPLLYEKEPFKKTPTGQAQNLQLSH